MKSDEFFESRLSPAGEARREAILLDVQAAMRRRQTHRRLARRLSLGVAAVGIAAVGLALGSALRPVESPGGRVQVGTVAAFERLEFERLESDNQVRSWTTLPSKPVDASQQADDEEFLALLEEAGYKAGFVRFEGKVLLAIADGGFVGLE